MRLQINKACDLSSISVLPPHSRRPNPSSSAADSSVLARAQASQRRSQSQQSFSQGVSLSQLSQGSFDEALTNDLRLGSQDRDQSTKRICSLPPLTVSREDSQVLTRSSNNIIQRWSSSSLPERKCQVSEELEHRFGLMENNLSRFGRILDSIQNDVMQTNKAVREVMLEVESIRQKTVTHDNSLQSMLKAEDDIGASVDRILKYCLEKKSEPDKSSFQEIFSLLSTLPDQIESRISTVHKELFTVMTKEMKALIGSWRPPSSVQPPSVHTQMARSDGSVISRKNLPVPAQLPILPAMDHKRTACALKLKGGIQDLSVNKQKHTLEPKPEIIVLSEQDQELQVTVDFDEEMDGGFSCLLQSGGVSYTLGDAKEETMRILRKARRRKRKFSNTINLT